MYIDIAAAGMGSGRDEGPAGELGGVEEARDAGGAVALQIWPNAPDINSPPSVARYA
jgi:hypothetical protein